MIFYDAPVSPDDLTAFVRRVPIPNDGTLLNLVPVELDGKNEFDWSEVLETNRTARFRTFDGRIHVSERDGGSDKRVPYAPLSDSLSMGEYERLQLEFARTGGTRTEALANAIYNDGQRLTRHVQNRMHQAIGDVLVDGKLTINENGLQAEADFGLPATHKVAAGTAWTNTAAPALDNMLAWLDVMVADGNMPGAILTSRRVKRLMQVNAQLIGAAVGTTSGKTRINDNELGDLLSAEGIPDKFFIVDDVVDVDGVTTRIIPDDLFMFVPASLGDLIKVRYGVSATALELVESNKSDLTFEDAPGIVGVVEKSGPPYRQFTFVDAVGLPVISDARKLFVADVA